MMSDFDMPSSGTWEQRGGWVVRALMRDFSLTAEQAAGLVGNLGFESIGFTAFHEIGQPEGLGGYGWAQWTGSRRRSFFAWCSSHNLDSRSDEANYGYLSDELRTTYASTVAALKRSTTLDAAVWSVGQTYERPGGTTATNLPAYKDRLSWAQRALNGASALPAATAVSGKPAAAVPPNDKCPDPDLVADLVRALQRVVGTDPDGIFGSKTAAAITQAQRKSA